MLKVSLRRLILSFSDQNLAAFIHEKPLITMLARLAP
jgi:hypothetical protein